GARCRCPRSDQETAMSTISPRRLARAALGLTVLATSATAVAGTLSASVAHAATGDLSQTFASTGTVQWFTVPAYVTRLQIQAVGGSGADGESVTVYTAAGSFVHSGGHGGRGGVITATVAVTPGEQLSVNVGGRGTSSSTGYGSARGGRSGAGNRNYFQF